MLTFNVFAQILVSSLVQVTKPRVISTRMFIKFYILGDLGADSRARESRNGRKHSGQRKVQGKMRSPLRQRFSRVVPKGLALSGSWLGAENFCIFLPNHDQRAANIISETVSCVLLQSSTRGSFVCHIASLFYHKSKALFLENRTVNAPLSLRTRK